VKGFRLAVIATWLGVFAPGRAAAQPDAGAVPDTGLVTREELRGLLEGLNEQLQAVQTDTDKLKRFKFTGYIQGRYDASEASSDSVKVSGAPFSVTTPNQSRFYIRRARFKLTYDSSPWSQAVIYFDGGQDRFIRLLEAYVTLMDPWTANHDHQFTLGQFNVPFGYELERSSSLRELPERSRAENVLFPGERDRGIKLEQQWTQEVKTSLSVLNGAGINSVDFPNIDPTRNKDVTARARLTQGTVDAAASYYWGHSTTPLTGPTWEHGQTRFGVDTQGYWQLPRTGGGSLRFELYTGHDVNPDSVKTLITAPTAGNPVRLLRPGADPAHLSTDVLGWYVMLVQNIGDRLQTAVRYDTYDPNTTLGHDQYARWSFGVNAFYDGYTRLTLSYDAVTTQTPGVNSTYTDPHDNLWTFQLQHKW
jgi:hypothetical protein